MAPSSFEKMWIPDIHIFPVVTFFFLCHIFRLHFSWTPKKMWNVEKMWQLLKFYFVLTVLDLVNFFVCEQIKPLGFSKLGKTDIPISQPFPFHSEPHVWEIPFRKLQPKMGSPMFYVREMGIPTVGCPSFHPWKMESKKLFFVRKFSVFVETENWFSF